METNDNVVVEQQIIESNNSDVFTLEKNPETTHASDNIAEYTKLKELYDELENQYNVLKGE